MRNSVCPVPWHRLRHTYGVPSSKNQEPLRFGGLGLGFPWGEHYDAPPYIVPCAVCQSPRPWESDIRYRYRPRWLPFLLPDLLEPSRVACFCSARGFLRPPRRGVPNPEPGIRTTKPQVTGHFWVRNPESQNPRSRGISGFGGFVTRKAPVPNPPESENVTGRLRFQGGVSSGWGEFEGGSPPLKVPAGTPAKPGRQGRRGALAAASERAERRSRGAPPCTAKACFGIT